MSKDKTARPLVHLKASLPPELHLRLKLAAVASGKTIPVKLAEILDAALPPLPKEARR